MSSVTLQEFNISYILLFPGRETVKLCYCEIIFVKCFDIVKFCYKLIIGKAEGLFAILVVWSVSYPLGEHLII